MYKRDTKNEAKRLRATKICNKQKKLLILQYLKNNNYRMGEKRSKEAKNWYKKWQRIFLALECTNIILPKLGSKSKQGQKLSIRT